jgi:hypothetical protein
MMVITLSPDLEASLNDAARRQGIAPEALALKVMRECLTMLTRKFAYRASESC